MYHINVVMNARMWGISLTKELLASQTLLLESNCSTTKLKKNVSLYHVVIILTLPLKHSYQHLILIK